MAVQTLNMHPMANPLQARKLAPAPDRASVLVAPHAKKKIAYNLYAGPQPASVARRNARERNRVKQVNNGFATLRQHIPPAVAATVSGGGRGASKKLSKVDTLKLAVEYIRSLQELLDDNDSEAGIAVQDNTFYDARSYYSSSPDSSLNHVPHTPPSSEASVSPSPSFASENSPPLRTTYTTKLDYPDAYEGYEPMSPADEELLDVISWWQQQ